MTFDDLEFNNYSRMDHVFRFSDTNLINRESDLHHVGSMIFLGLYIVDDLRKFYNNDSLINEEVLISKIVHHDLNEIVDIPRSMKYFSKEFHDAVESVSDQMMIKLGMPESRLEKIHSSKSEHNVESALCSILDVLQCACTLRKEYNLQKNANIRSRYLECLHGCIDNMKKHLSEDWCKCISERIKYYMSLVYTEYISITGESYAGDI